LTRRGTVHRSYWILALIACLAGLQLYAFRWGVITPDTVDQYGQALTGQYDDWHPPITTWIWRQLLRIWAGSAGYLVFDLLVYWSAIFIIAHAMARRGWMGAILVIAVAAAPIPFGQMGAILKDPLLASFCLLASALIIANRRDILPLNAAAGILIVMASAMRFNAPFATMPLLIALLPPRWVSGPVRLVSIVIIAVPALMLSSWTINVAALKPHRSEPIFSLVNFDLAGIVAYGGGNVYPQLGSSDAVRLTRNCYDDRLYNPSNTMLCNIVEDSLMDFSHRTGNGALRIWLAGVMHARLPYLHHRLAHLNWNWRFLLRDVPKDAFYMMSEPNDLGLKFTPNPITKTILGAARAMAWSPFGRPITWLAVALGLLVIAPVLPSSRHINMLSCSALGYGLAYVFVSVAPDMRYNLWTIIAAMLAAAVALSDLGHGSNSVSKPRLMLATAPVLLVIVLESIWLLLPNGAVS
jgi:hypothetical protein